MLIDGSVIGSPGCGGFAGSYSWVGPKKLQAKVFWVLGGYCYDMEKAIAQNKAVTAALNQPLSVERNAADGFTLLDQNGKSQITLMPE